MMKGTLKLFILLICVCAVVLGFSSCGECKHEQTSTRRENEISATCTASGSYDEIVYCTECGDKFSITKKTVNATGHSEITHGAKAPTCTKIGWAAYVTCENCDYTTYAEIPAAHSIVEHQAKAPSCTEIGFAAYETCENCDYTTYTEIEKTSHSEIPHDAKAPTCTEIGWAAYVTCEDCDYSTYAEIKELGHSKIPHVAKEPSCTEHGWEVYETCENCSYTTYSEIPAGHTYESGACIRCGELKASDGLNFQISSNGTYYSVDLGSCTDKYVVIPKTYKNLPVKKIAYSGFMSRDIVSVIIPEGVETIESYAFSDCTHLVSVTIPSTVTKIEQRAFSGCYRLVEVINKSNLNIKAGLSDYGEIAYRAKEVHSGESKIVDVDGCLFIKSGGVNYLVSYVGNDSEIILPESYMGENYKINDFVFASRDEVTDNTILSIPAAVTEIGMSAFSNCRNITTVIIPDTVTRIGSSLFAVCYGLEYIDFGDGITHIPESVLKHCSSLKTVIMPENIKSIANEAFYKCESLTNVYIKDLAGWCGVSYDNSISSPLVYAQNLYLKDDLITELVIPEGVTSISEWAFVGCVNITSVVIPTTVSIIEYATFSGCTGLKSVVIPIEMESIVDFAFSSTGITDVYYYGSEKDWAKIKIYQGNEQLTSANMHYNYNPEEQSGD